MTRIARLCRTLRSRDTELGAIPDGGFGAWTGAGASLLRLPSLLWSPLPMPRLLPSLRDVEADCMNESPAALVRARSALLSARMPLLSVTSENATDCMSPVCSMPAKSSEISETIVSFVGTRRMRFCFSWSSLLGVTTDCRVTPETLESRRAPFGSVTTLRPSRPCIPLGAATDLELGITGPTSLPLDCKLAMWTPTLWSELSLEWPGSDTSRGA